MKKQAPIVPAPGKTSRYSKQGVEYVGTGKLRPHRQTYYSGNFDCSGRWIVKPAIR